MLALIGESGSGKTTIALALLGYARRGCRLSGGVVQIGEHDMLALSESELQGLRGNRVSYIAQSAAAAFNPAKKTYRPSGGGRVDSWSGQPGCA